MAGDSRGIWSRLGIVAINLIAPGSGVLRVGSLRLALIFLLAFPAAFVLPYLWFDLAPVPGFAGYLAGLTVYAVIALTALIGSIVVSWRRSKYYREDKWWSRWPAVVGFLIVSVIISNLLIELDVRPYRTFYIPSVAMAPTLDRNDKLFAAMNPRQSLQRGDLVLVEASGEAIYIKRVAGLPGDRIELNAGQLVLNRQRVPQTLRHVEPISAAIFGDPTQADRLSERFPGEGTSHDIYDIGYRFDVDDFPPTTVEPGHIFVLGDNRDQSADSRVSRSLGGLDQVPLSKVKGIPLFTYWSASPERRFVRLRH